MRQLESWEKPHAKDFVLAAIIARGMSSMDFDPTEAEKAVAAGLTAYIAFEGHFDNGQDQQI